MEIRYTYKEPEDRPIKRAELETYYDDNVEMEISEDNEVNLKSVDIKINFTKEDFDDFADLVNRINRQINGGE